MGRYLQSANLGLDDRQVSVFDTSVVVVQILLNTSHLLILLINIHTFGSKENNFLLYFITIQYPYGKAHKRIPTFIFVIAILICRSTNCVQVLACCCHYNCVLCFGYCLCDFYYHSRLKHNHHLPQSSHVQASTCLWPVYKDSEPERDAGTKLGRFTALILTIMKGKRSEGVIPFALKFNDSPDLIHASATKAFTANKEAISDVITRIIHISNNGDVFLLKLEILRQPL